MRTEVTGAARHGPAGTGARRGTGRDRWRSLAGGLRGAALTVLVLVVLGVAGFRARGVLGAVGGAVAGLILIGVARMLLALSGATELIRRRRHRH